MYWFLCLITRVQKKIKLFRTRTDKLKSDYLHSCIVFLHELQIMPLTNRRRFRIKIGIETDTHFFVCSMQVFIENSIIVLSKIIGYVGANGDITVT